MTLASVAAAGLTSPIYFARSLLVIRFQQRTIGTAPAARAWVAGAAVVCAAWAAGLIGCGAPGTAAKSDAGWNLFKGKEKQMSRVTSADFGKTKDGKPVTIYTLTNSNGLIARVMTYGATLTEMHIPTAGGHFGDVVAGFDNLADYEAKSPFFGATTGRVANRIAGGEFTLDGETYQLAINNGPNTLHGGKVGFDKKIWTGKVVSSKEGPAVQFHYLSPDMEENFPGNLDVKVTYTLTEDNALRIDYKATTDKPTIVNLTNHSYWNLSAFEHATILNEILELNARQFTPAADTLIPTGRLKSVYNTVFDFTAPTAIGSRIKEVPISPPVGYDHNFVIDGTPGAMNFCARVVDPESGRQMEIWTTEPGVQFYTGNFLDGKVVGIGRHKYVQHAAFCLETQHFPDSIHHPNFPSTVLRPGQVYSSTTIHKFSAR
jgi:aldose 1-epimerase